MELDSALIRTEILERLRAERLFFIERGISWTMAKDIGVDFSVFQDVPEGVYEVELLLKIWNKKYPILHCYFVDINNEDNLYVLSAFTSRDHADKFYSSTTTREIDYSYEPLGSLFRIEVGVTKRSNRSLWISGTKL